ncbi:MAG TPA: SDR family NAD(P)-dependent oxidoreductase, partial [Verrucomicrobiae bacterium]
MKPIEMFDLSGEVAVVIGGTGALGGAIAQALGEAGAKVAVLGRNEQRGAARVKEISAQGGQAAFFTADAMSRDSLHSANDAIQSSFGPAGILVNAAGGTDPKSTVSATLVFEQIQLEDWRANFDLNLVGGVLLPCQEFGPGMVQRGRGSIINIASVSAHLPLSRVIAYSAA